MKRRFFLVGAPLALAACGAPARETVSTQQLVQAAYRHDGPPNLTLMTMVNNNSGAGAHTSLMINGSQRVIWDPAGSVRINTIVEQNDVLYGITPRVEEFYKRAHARTTFHVWVQSVDVAPGVAERALQLAVAQGPAAPATCAQTTSGILAQLPGFEGIRRTWYPVQLAESFAQVTGVQGVRLREEDDEDLTVALKTYVPA